MKLPKVSIIIPTYNRSKKISIAIESCVSQIFRDIEIVIINDGGEDVSEIINSFKDDRIKYINLEKNVGRAEARNVGIKKSLGECICYLDDDDKIYPEHVVTLFNFIENKKVDIAYTNSYRVLETQIGKSIHYYKKANYNKLLVRNFIPILSFMHKKSCLDIVGYYDINLKYYEDWDLIIRLSEKFNFHHINKVTSEFFFRNDFFNIEKELIIIKDLYYIYKKYYKNDFIISINRRFYIENSFSKNSIDRFFLNEFNIGLDFIKLHNFNESKLIFNNLMNYFPEIQMYKYYYFISILEIEIKFDILIELKELHNIILDKLNNINKKEKNKFLLFIFYNKIYFNYIDKNSFYYLFIYLFSFSFEFYKFLIFYVIKSIFTIKKQIRKLK
ncbi:MAG: glycosyltransferase [Cyanobacteriota bacterium]